MKSIANKKIVLIITTGLLFTVASPAEAHAPQLSKSMKVKMVALQMKPELYALTKMKDYGWKKSHYQCLENLWTKESHWNPKANNPQSTAFGIAQMLNETAKDAVTQINNGLRYISYRYDNPCSAWSYWQRHYWY